MGKLVSKVYGDALFSLTLEENTLPIVWEEVKLITETLQNNEELSSLMTHPGLTSDEKQGILRTVFEDGLSDTMMGFLCVILQKRHFDKILSVLDYFQSRAKEHNKIGIAYVTTALPIANEQKEKIERKLLEVTTYQSFEMHFNEEHELIGGMRVRIGDRIVDDSIKAKLDEMKEGVKKA